MEDILFLENSSEKKDNRFSFSSREKLNHESYLLAK